MAGPSIVEIVNICKKPGSNTLHDGIHKLNIANKITNMDQLYYKLPVHLGTDINSNCLTCGSVYTEPLNFSPKNITQ